jgi:hypothetical protein
MAMRSKNKPRANVRLRLDRGTVLIKQFGMTSVSCVIVDLSESGCQCRLMLGELDAASAMAWKTILMPGRILTIELTEPPELQNLMINEAEVRWVRPGKTDTELDFGFSLANTDPQQKQVLGEAMLNIAADKLRAKKAEENKRSGRLPAQSAQPVESSPPPAPVTSTQASLVPRESSAHTSFERDPDAPSSGSRSAVGRHVSAAAAASDTTFQRQKRHRLIVPVLYRFRDSSGNILDAEMYKGHTLNFNEGGFQIEGPASKFCEPGDLLTKNAYVQATFNMQPTDIIAGCRVRTVEPSPDLRGCFILGLQLIDISETDKRTIRELYIRAGLTMIIKKR